MKTFWAIGKGGSRDTYLTTLPHEFGAGEFTEGIDIDSNQVIRFGSYDEAMKVANRVMSKGCLL